MREPIAAATHPKCMMANNLFVTPSTADAGRRCIRRRNFSRYWTGNFLAILGMQMQSVTVVWEVYSEDWRSVDVGMVGLVQVDPVLSLALFAGHVADRFDRRLVLMAAVGLAAVASLGLVLVSWFQWPIALMFVCLFFVGVAPRISSAGQKLVRAAVGAARDLPHRRHLEPGRLSTGLDRGTGPGGHGVGRLRTRLRRLRAANGARHRRLIGFLTQIRHYATDAPHEGATLRSLGEGIGFVWSNKVILGAMALDMFAVLLGGATALLPVFAKSMLEVDARGLRGDGVRAGLGALMMSLALDASTADCQGGPDAAVGRGRLRRGDRSSSVCPRSTSSRWRRLVLIGAFDCVSVVVRHTLIQMCTPDRMRGRVSAISGMFISASNELGEFESGLLARLTSPVFAGSSAAGSARWSWSPRGPVAFPPAPLWPLGRQGPRHCRSRSRSRSHGWKWPRSERKLLVELGRGQLDQERRQPLDEQLHHLGPFRPWRRAGLPAPGWWSAGARGA